MRRDCWQGRGVSDMTMICERCGQAGIRWMGAFSNLTHTECPHCGGMNCQRGELPDDAEQDEQSEAEQ